jgi:hypothetical protein
MQALLQFADMASSSGITDYDKMSPEQFVEAYQRKYCHKCGSAEKSGQRFMVCGGCEGPSYCS